MEFFRQEYWNGLPFLSSRESSWPRDLTRVSCVSCFASRFFTWWTIGEALIKQRPMHSHGRMGNSLAVPLKLSLYQTFFFFYCMCYFLTRIHTHTHTDTHGWNLSPLITKALLLHVMLLKKLEKKSQSVSKIKIQSDHHLLILKSDH